MKVNSTNLGQNTEKEEAPNTNLEQNTSTNLGQNTKKNPFEKKKGPNTNLEQNKRKIEEKTNTEKGENSSEDEREEGCSREQENHIPIQVDPFEGEDEPENGEPMIPFGEKKYFVRYKLMVPEP